MKYSSFSEYFVSQVLAAVSYKVQVFNTRDPKTELLIPALKDYQKGLAHEQDQLKFDISKTQIQITNLKKQIAERQSKTEAEQQALIKANVLEHQKLLDHTIKELELNSTGWVKIHELFKSFTQSENPVLNQVSSLTPKLFTMVSETNANLERHKKLRAGLLDPDNEPNLAAKALAETEFLVNTLQQAEQVQAELEHQVQILAQQNTQVAQAITCLEKPN